MWQSVSFKCYKNHWHGFGLGETSPPPKNSPAQLTAGVGQGAFPGGSCTQSPCSAAAESNRWMQPSGAAWPSAGNRLISAGKSLKKPSEEINQPAGYITHLGNEKSPIFQSEKVQTSLSCLSRKFPNHQPKAQLGQGRAGSFCPLSWWCLSKMQTWGEMVEIWWVSSPAKAFLATLGLHITSAHYSTKPVHVPRGGARINVSSLAKNLLFCW